MSTETTSQSSTPTPKSSHSTSYSPQSTTNINSQSKTTNNSDDNKQSNQSLPETSKFQVFLGGSCNPTTWRRNVAIPYLEINGISYYNPQIDNWTPDAVNLERSAKQDAQLLLFVIDKQTRSTVGIVESAYIAGEKKNLILVLYPFDYNIVCLTDRQTQSNIETRSKRTTTTTTTTKTVSRPIDYHYNHHNHQQQHEESSSSSIESTTSSTLLSANTSKHAANSSTQLAASALTKTTIMSSKITSAYGKGEKCNHDERSLERTHHEANVQASESIKMSGELISSREFQELRQARYILQILIALQKIPLFSDISQGLKYITCCLSSDRSNDSNKLQQQYTTESDLDLCSMFNQRLNSVSEPNKKQRTIITEKANDAIASLKEKLDLSHSEPMKDVYLSFDGDDCTNVESTVLPILKEKGLTFNYIPFKNTLEIDNNDIKTPTTQSSLSTNHQSLFLPKFPITITRANPNSIANTNTSELQQNYALSSYPEVSHSKTTTTTSSSSSSFDFYEKTKLALEKEICAIRRSRILLFVITNKCRGLSIMVLASHFMALFRNNVVLCLQYLEEPCSIGGEMLSETAIADYNRGRVYLSDYAAKSQVPIFNNIKEAVECCSLKCRYDNNKNK